MANAVIGDIRLSNPLPQCEYMYGCVPTVVGMMLAYYDLYGYDGEDVSNLIEGTPELDARNTDASKYDMNAFHTVLGNFVASEEYVARFYDKTPEEEKDYTWSSFDNYELNISVWNSLSDWLGTGQIWRGCQDKSTTHYISTLETVLATTQTTTEMLNETESITFPIRFNDWKYGLSLYVETRGYTLDAKKTRTTRIDTASGSFTFEDYAAEIDAGHPVIFATANHVILGYGYNEETREIIFDDCYDNEQRVVWGDTFIYAGVEMSIITATTVAFHLGDHFDGNLYRQTVHSHAYFTGKKVTIANCTIQGRLYCGGGSPETTSFTQKVFSISNVTANRLFAGDHYDHVTQIEIMSATVGIMGGTFTNGIFGGSNAKYSTILADTKLVASGVTSNIFVGGNYSSESNPGEETNTVSMTGDTYLSIKDSEISQFIIGGSLIGSNTTELREGDTFVSIRDSVCNGTVLGGTLLQSHTRVGSTTTGDIMLILSGVTVDGCIYGGGGALKNGPTRNLLIDGSTEIEIDITTPSIINGSIFAGGCSWSRITGTSTILFTGESDTPFKCNYISGDSAFANTGSRLVGNDDDALTTLPRSLYFTEFRGTIDARFIHFDALYISDDSCLTISRNGDFSSFFVMDISRGDPDDISINFSNGCNIDFISMELQLHDDHHYGTDWTVIQSTAADDFYNLSDAYVYLNGEQLSYEENDDFIGFCGDNGCVWVDEESASLKASLTYLS